MPLRKAYQKFREQLRGTVIKPEALEYFPPSDHDPYPPKEPHTMKRLSLALCAAAFAAASTLPALASDIVFSQTGATYDNYATMANNSPDHPVPLTGYDNFTLSADTTLTRVDWTGIHIPDAYKPIGNFSLMIYADNGQDAPGSLLYTQPVNGNASETFISEINAFNLYTYNYNSYTAPINFTVMANTEYWFGLYADTANELVFGWMATESGDHLSWQTQEPGSTLLFPHDNAFTLHGGTPTVPSPPVATTPEPGSLILMGSGMLTMAGMVRRRLVQR